MSSRTTASRILALAALAFSLASCASQKGDVSTAAGPEDPAILKISYFRAFPDGKSKRLENFFRCVMSESWKDRMGDGPREPPHASDRRRSVSVPR